MVTVPASKRGNSPQLPRVTMLSCHHLLSGNTAMRAGHAMAASSQIWWRDTNVHVVQQLMVAALGTKMENISVAAWREWKTKEQDKTEAQNCNMNLSKRGDISATDAIISNTQACDCPGVNPGRVPWKALLWIPWEVGQSSAYGSASLTLPFVEICLQLPKPLPTFTPFRWNVPWWQSASSWILLLHFRRKKERKKIKRERICIFLKKKKGQDIFFCPH